MSDPATSFDLGLGGSHEQAQKNVGVAVASLLQEPWDELVRLQGLKTKLSSRVVFADLVEMFQGLIICD